MAQNKIRLVELEELGIRVVSFGNMPEETPEKSDGYYSYIHDHPFCELHVVEKGSFLLYAADMVHSLGEGQFCLIAPGIYHAPRSAPDAFRRVCVSFELMKKSAPVRDRLESAGRERPVWVGDAGGLLPVLSMLRQEAGQSGGFSEEALRSLMALLMIRLARSMEAGPFRAQSGGGGLDELRSAIVDDFFASNFNLSAGEEALAGRLGVSRRQLDRIMKKHFGMSFREKLTEIRTEVACDMLRTGGRSIREIAELVGYSAPSNFTAFFRRATGMTPQQYRDEIRKE